MSEKLYTGFHGTDQCGSDGITKNNFTFTPRKDHWLGQGIYFFKEKDLAIWWAKTKAQKNQQIPIVYLATICSNNTLNLMDKSILEKFIKSCTRIYKDLIKFSSVKPKDGAIDEHTFMCILCDYYKEENNVDLIIYKFNKNNRSSCLDLNKGERTVMEMAGLTYDEIQYCVTDVKSIINKSIIWMGDDIYV